MSNPATMPPPSHDITERIVVHARLRRRLRSAAFSPRRTGLSRSSIRGCGRLAPKLLRPNLYASRLTGGEETTYVRYDRRVTLSPQAATRMVVVP